MWKSRNTTRILDSPGADKKIVEYIGFSGQILGEFYDYDGTEEYQRSPEEEIEVGNSPKKYKTEQDDEKWIRNFNNRSK